MATKLSPPPLVSTNRTALPCPPPMPALPLRKRATALRRKGLGSGCGVYERVRDPLGVHEAYRTHLRHQLKDVPSRTVALNCGLDEETAYQVVRGKKTPTLSAVKVLAQTLGMPELVDGHPAVTPKTPLSHTGTTKVFATALAEWIATHPKRALFSTRLKASPRTVAAWQHGTALPNPTHVTAILALPDAEQLINAILDDLNATTPVPVLSEQLRALRYLAGQSQRQAATIAGIQVSTWNWHEQGKSNTYALTQYLAQYQTAVWATLHPVAVAVFTARYGQPTTVPPRKG